MPPSPLAHLGVPRPAAHALLAAALLAVGGAAPALAHDGPPPTPGDPWAGWTVEPRLLLGLLLAGLVYAGGVRRLWRRAGRGRGIRVWQVVAYAGGLVTLALALASPLDRLATALFTAHMVQHVLLIVVAAPLLVLGAPATAWFWAVPGDRRRALGAWWRRAPLPRAGWHILTRPLVVWGLHAGALWLWHLPAPFQAALTNAPLHALEHASLLGTAIPFWWLVVQPSGRRRLAHGPAVLVVFTMAMQGGLLGALMTFARTPWYPAYTASAAAWGLTGLEDQQLAGLVMWVLAAGPYLAAALLLIAAWLRAAERRSARATGSAAARRPGAPLRRAR